MGWVLLYECRGVGLSFGWVCRLDGFVVGWVCRGVGLSLGMSVIVIL